MSAAWGSCNEASVSSGGVCVLRVRRWRRSSESSCGAGGSVTRQHLDRRPQRDSQRVLVRVNGEIVTHVGSRPAADRRHSLEEHRHQNITDANVLRLMNEVTPDVLVDTVNEMLLVQRGQELRRQVHRRRVPSEGVEGLKKDNKLDDAGLRQALAREAPDDGAASRKLRARIHEGAGPAGRSLPERCASRKRSCACYYAAHKDEFTTPENITLRELFVAAPAVAGSDARPEDNAVAKTKIDALRARAVGGEDFVALVKAESDAATESAGGLIGPLNWNDINPTVKDVVSGLKAGEISQPLAMPAAGIAIRN